ncbi:MAG: CheR family methyltransferase [Hyphomonas sp.]
MADILLRRTGRRLSPEKAYLATSRLGPLARSKGLGDPAGLINALPSQPDAHVADEIAAALVPKETWFFRGRPMLERLAASLPARIAPGRQTLRIWCAGAGTGQEAFSLAILIGALPGNMAERVELVATDLSLHAVRRARAGEFDHFDVQKGLTATELVSHFRPLASGAWQASPALSGRIQFRQHNLLDGADDLGTFDIILCRNVLSGMTRRASLQALGTLEAALAPGGQLILGESETLAGLTGRMAPSQSLRGAWARVSEAGRAEGASVVA